MMLGEKIFAQAMVLAGQPEGNSQEMLRILCQVTADSLLSRLKEGLTEEDCQEALVNGGSLYALAAWNGVQADEDVQEFRAGDLTIKRGGETSGSSAETYRMQAEKMLQPYLKDRFAFLGV